MLRAFHRQPKENPMPTPWKVAEQSVTLLDKETGEPAGTLVFAVDHQNAHEVELRLVKPDGAKAVMRFATGGYLSGAVEYVDAPPPPAEAEAEAAVDEEVATA
jgi:hypothetical protein